MVQVTVKQGVLEGEKVDNQYGESYYSFKAIPYALPPVGDLRFKAPQPPASWTGVRSAKEHGPVCIQHDLIFTNQNIGSEDCLYLNVYTPEITPNTTLPVMFYIHGGAFMCGSGNDDMYGPEFLVKKDVVLVTINYRLYTLGFLCLDSQNIPGNAGIKDQVAAMRWVKENISKFGGNPENITIFGESAGAASVSWHLISPMTKGLFKRAIIQSGSATCYWANTFKPREKAIAFARNCGMNSENDLEVSKFLMSLPAETLIQEALPITLAEKANVSEIQFAVVSEKDFGQERFFYGDVFKAFCNGVHEGVEIMCGYCSHEGMVKLKITKNFEEMVFNHRQYRELFVPKRLTLNISLHDQFEVGKLIKNHYYGEKDITTNNLLPLVHFFSWDMFVYDSIQSHRYYTKGNNKTYLYKFTCKSKRNLFKHMYVTDPKIAVELGEVTSHGDDILYLFPVKALGQKIEENSAEHKMIEKVVKLWTNFAKYGNPTPDDSLGIKWTPYTLDEQAYVDIGENLLPGTTPDHEDYQLYEKLYRKYMPHTVL